VGSYYYLMAQLPFLIYDQKPPMSSAEFKALAEPMMEDEDAVFFNRLSIDPASENALSSGCDFIDNWREWERSLRLNLAKHRAIKLKRDSSSAVEPPPYPADAASSAARAVTGDMTPLEGEILIDKARWNAIDAITGYEYFGRNNVYAYFLKLILLERRMLFNVEKGFTEYKSLYAEIIENSQDSGHNSPGELK